MGRNPNQRGNESVRPLGPSRLAWLPVPVLSVAMAVLWAADLRGSHESLYLLVTLNFVFSTLVSLFVACLIARSFLVRGTPGLLLLGCGVILWGLAGVLGPAAARGDANISITIHNICTWLSALCHLAGVLLSLRPRRPLSPTAVWLPAAYALTAGAAALVTLSVLAGWIPTFFVQGQGGTPLRHFVLLSAIIMFALTVSLLRATTRRPLSAFAYWYTLALTLIVIGLCGVTLQSSRGSILGWTGRATQLLGCLYMLIASVASVRESHAWGISLEEALRESEERYRTLLETAPDAIVVHRGGRFLYANSAALLLTGAESFAELARHPVLDFFCPPDREQAAERTCRAMAGNKLPMRAATLLRLDGQEVTVEFHTAPLDFLGARAILTILRDITERKQAEEALRQALLESQQRCAEISALMTCTRAVLECRDLASAVRAVFNACRELLGAQAGYVAALAPDGQYQEVLFLEPGGLPCTVDPSLPMPVRGFRAEAYRMGRVVYENDFANSSWTRSLPPGHVRLENVLFAPMVIDGGVIGLLGLGNKPEGFTDHDATLAATFGELMAIALRNSRTLESLQELNATLESKVAERTAQLERRTRQLQKLTLELSQAEERERRRIAVVLHEDLQQQIAGAKFHLSLLKGRTTYGPPQQAVVDSVDAMLKEAIEKSRRLSHDLSPAVLHMNDLREVLQWLAKQVRARQGLTIQVDISGGVALQSEALTMFLFRAAQELLFNVVKHARVTEAAIRVRRIGRYVCLCVSDQGHGFDPRDLGETAGFGLFSLHERVELLGGRMRIESANGSGTVVRIVVPNALENGKQPAVGRIRTKKCADHV